MRVAFYKAGEGRLCGWTAAPPRRRPFAGTTMAAGRDLPHDLAQFVVEEQLGLEHGFWGVLAQGGSFKSVPGRRQTQPGRQITRDHQAQLGRAEAIVNAHVNAWKTGTATPLGTALDAMLVRWRALALGDELRLDWNVQGRRGRRTKGMKRRTMREGWGMALLLLGGAIAAGAGSQAATAASGSDEAGIRSLVATYAKSIDAADTTLASTIWATTPEVSFIHPRGHERGWNAIKAQFYEQTMGQLFSERKLTVKDLSIHCSGQSAWAEFYWDFAAKLRKDGSSVATHGRETQVYRKIDGAWRLVHVHYSSMPVTGERQGF